LRLAPVGAGPAAAPADMMTFKLLPRYSRATFKSDAPLETFIGTTADSGILSWPAACRRDSAWGLAGLSRAAAAAAGAQYLPPSFW
jgi:hypothetical protein